MTNLVGSLIAWSDPDYEVLGLIATQVQKFEGKQFGARSVFKLVQIDRYLKECKLVVI